MVSILALILGSILFLTGAPIFVVFAMVGLIICLFEMSLPLTGIFHIFWQSVNSFVLLAVPAFILAGNIMAKGKITERLFGFANSLVGHRQGSLALATIICGYIFAGVSGSSGADTSALAIVMVPLLVKYGYGKSFGTALCALSGILGNIIPPSIFLILYGPMVNESVGRLFLAGLIPGSLIALFLAVQVVAISRIRGFRGLGDKCSWSERGREFLGAIPALLVPIVSFGGIYLGFFTITEAAAVAVFLALLAAIYYRGEALIGFWFVLKETFWLAVKDTIKTTSMVFFIIAGASLLGKALTYIGVPKFITDIVIELNLGAFNYIWACVILWLIIGCFMEPIAVMYCTIPFLWPAAAQLTISAIHFGTILTVCLMIGQITPPVGTVVYIASSITNEPAEIVFREALPLLLPVIVVLILTVVFPELTLFLPRLWGR